MRNHSGEKKDRTFDGLDENVYDVYDLAQQEELRFTIKRDATDGVERRRGRGRGVVGEKIGDEEEEMAVAA